MLKRSLSIPAVILLAGFCGCSKLPAGDTNNAEIRELNLGLADMAQLNGCDFLDTYYPMVDNNGNPDPFYYMPDGEHLSSAGYRRWARNILVPYLSTHPQYTKVAMVGDSITNRVYVVPSTVENHETTWTDLLSTVPVQAVNQGVDGDTTQDVMDRMDSIIQPDVQCYFLMIGNNDLHAGIPVPDTIQNVETLAQSIASLSGKPVVIQAVMPLCY